MKDKPKVTMLRELAISIVITEMIILGVLLALPVLMLGAVYIILFG